MRYAIDVSTGNTFACNVANMAQRYAISCLVVFKLCSAALGGARPGDGLQW